MTENMPIWLQHPVTMKLLVAGGVLEAILASSGRVAVAAATLDIELMPQLQVQLAPAPGVA